MGRPSDEDASQLWLMPEIGTTYEEDGVEYALVEYALPIVSCEFKVKETSTAGSASACTSAGFCFLFFCFLPKLFVFPDKTTPNKKPMSPKQQSRGKSNKKKAKPKKRKQGNANTTNVKRRLLQKDPK